MKKIFLLLAFGLFLSTANAQLLRFGIKAGASSSTIRADDVVGIIDERGISEELRLRAEGATFGFHVGLMSRINIPLTPFHVQPEFLFTSAGGRFTAEDVSSGAILEEDVRQTLNRVDIPVLLGYKMGPVRLVLGPVASFVLSDGFSLDSVDDFESDFNSATWGGQIGLGVDILNKLTLDLRYEGNLSKLGDEVNVGNSSFNLDSRASQIIFSVGYMFGGN